MRALADPGFHADRPRSVVHLQTHLSHVFVADRFTYKMKKPVRFSFADFSDVERRRLACAAEVRLNRRLCPTVYLGTAAIVRDARGRLQLDVGLGSDAGVDPARELVEPLVRMRTLPTAGMGHHALASGRLDRRRLLDFARVLAAFHSSLHPEPVDSPGAGPDALVRRWQAVLDDARTLVGSTLDEARRAVLSDFGPRFVARHTALVRGRAARGRVREGHGDLHLGNLCLVSPALPEIDGAPSVPEGLVAFDCIEFSRDLRTGDVAAEVAFLAMDLEADGFAADAAAFIDAYADASGDTDLARLLPFFVAFRSLVRGMVLGLETLDDAIETEERTRAAGRSRAHFALAARAAWRSPGTLILVCCGLSGSGKSTVAAALADASGFEIVSSDELRKRRAGLDPNAAVPVDARSTLYAPDARRVTYAALADAAAASVGAGRSAIWAATFNRADDRALLAAVARERGVPLLFVECRLDDERAVARIEERARRPAPGARSDADAAVRRAQASEHEALRADEPRIVIDTTGTVEATGLRAVEAAWRWCRDFTPGE